MTKFWRLSITVVMLQFFGFIVGSVAWADTGCITNFNQCPQHFWQGVPPNSVFDPSGKEQYPLCFSAFASLYSGVANTTLYSAHHLTKDDIVNARTLSRKDSFRSESCLPKDEQASLDDYKHSGYDRGHLVPNGDMPDRQRQYDSFSLANIVPQNSEHNRGVWRQIESHTRTLTHRYGESYMVTGTAFLGEPKTLHDMVVPSHLYKAVYFPKQNLAGAYFSPNDGSMTYEVIGVDELTRRVGVQVFPTTTAQFDPAIFDLDSRDDDSEELAGDDWLSVIVQIITALWQALQTAT